MLVATMPGAGYWRRDMRSTTMRLILHAMCTLAAPLTSLPPAGLLAQVPDVPAAFASPPRSARPWVYWFFMDGNMTREGITADLEAMAKAGIGGVIMMEVNVGIPRGPVAFMGAEWRAHFKHAVSEAERLGIQVTLNAGPGWTGSGGPWVRPEQSMQHLVASEAHFAGPSRIAQALPRPAPRAPYFAGSALPAALQQAKDDFYRDVAILAFPSLATTNQIADIDEKALYVRHPFTSRPGTKPFIPEPSPDAPAPPSPSIPTNAIVDLTSHMAADGTLTWDVPPGEWTVLRFGRTSTGANTRPAPIPGLGLECDKFDKSALDAHFDAYVGALLRELGPRKAAPDSGWNMLHIDSWEMGAQNGSAAFVGEFRKRRGYDPTPFLPTLTGRAIQGIEISERFLWDLRQTAQELVVENHASHLKALGRRHGLGLSIEPYDMNPCADMTLGAVADVPMCEFWLYGFNSSFSVIEAASIAHTCGRPIVAAEAFTSSHAEAWQAHPASMKALGDWAFCAGVNRIAFHRYQHQPWPGHRPGMTMGPYGVHWERTQTWWDMSRAYHDYLGRCQLLLRRGLPVADVLFLCAEGAPHVFRPPSSATSGKPPDHLGYRFDGCAPETFLERAAVQGGNLVFPDGVAYRVLVLPERETMTPALLHKVRDLARQGATVIGPPPARSPSLTGYPDCDTEVRAIAREMWANLDGLGSTRRNIGQGRVIWHRGRSPGDTAPPDNPLAAARWIWHQAGGPPAPVGKRFFHREIVIDRGAQIDSAKAFMTADNAYALSVNGRRAGSGENFHRLDTIDIARLLRPGTNSLDVVAENGGDAPNPAGLIGSVVIRFRDGRLLSVPTNREWLSAADAVGTRAPASELGPPHMPPWKLDPRPAPPEPEQYGDFRHVSEALAAMGVPPDFESTGPIRFTHRRDGASDIYFVANREDQRVDADCIFRVDGKSPQIWDPVSGAILPLPQHAGASGRTRIRLRFEPHQSLFVVFGTATPPAPKRRDFEGPVTLLTLDGPWGVTFDAALGGPASATFERLADWSQHPDDRIRFYSGPATYSTAFDFNGPAIGDPHRPVFLDLGRVEVIASVRLNGSDIGTAWCPPWRVDISSALKPADNRLEITVANLWPNRLIGDERFPDDCTTNGTWRTGPLPEWPPWLLDRMPRPEPRRITFATFKHWRKDDPLLPSGLLGPVSIVADP